MSTTATGIRQISLVCVPEPDQDTAIAFYESLDFRGFKRRGLRRLPRPAGGG
jgi:hypothetical protein